MSQHSVNPAKTPRTCKFSARLFEFSLQDANTFFNEKKDSVDNKMQIGFARFIRCLDSYLDLLDGFTIIGETRINIYGSVTLENGAIMRATNRYHNKAWFSNIAISMDSEESNDYISDKGLCYGQVFCQFVYNFIYKSNNKYLLFIGLIVSRSINRPTAKSRINSMV